MAQIQYNWCPHNKRRCGRRHAEGRAREDEGEDGVYTPRREAAGKSNPTDTSISDFWPLELWENKCHRFSHPVCGALSRHLSWLTHSLQQSKYRTSHRYYLNNYNASSVSVQLWSTCTMSRDQRSVHLKSQLILFTSLISSSPSSKFPFLQKYYYWLRRCFSSTLFFSLREEGNKIEPGRQIPIANYVRTRPKR